VAGEPGGHCSTKALLPSEGVYTAFVRAETCRELCQTLKRLIAIIQTSWPHIRVALYVIDDGFFQFIEEGHAPDEQWAAWEPYFESGLYTDRDTAQREMIGYYCFQAEDEYDVDPKSVTILEPPSFEGPYHPVLRPKR
jgi:hypothetical protein